jgi:phenylalanyl-tRNA synthetase beta chain
MLQNLELFDLYRGEGIDSGQKSLALSLTFQAPSRTLDEAEVEVSVANILASLSRQLGATLRG